MVNCTLSTPSFPVDSALNDASGQEMRTHCDNGHIVRNGRFKRVHCNIINALSVAGTDTGKRRAHAYKSHNAVVCQVRPEAARDDSCMSLQLEKSSERLLLNLHHGVARSSEPSSLIIRGPAGTDKIRHCHLFDDPVAFTLILDLQPQQG